MMVDLWVAPDFTCVVYLSQINGWFTSPTKNSAKIPQCCGSPSWRLSRVAQTKKKSCSSLPSSCRWHLERWEIAAWPCPKGSLLWCPPSTNVPCRYRRYRLKDRKLCNALQIRRIGLDLSEGRPAWATSHQFAIHRACNKVRGDCLCGRTGSSQTAWPWWLDLSLDVCISGTKVLAGRHCSRLPASK